MASSQIEIASSSPFVCVLRDHNRHEGCNRESNARAAAFQKNLQGLVRENLHTCISVSSDRASNDNPRNHINTSIDDHHQDLRRLPGNQDSIAKNVNDSSTRRSNQARILDQWAAMQARQMVSTIERQSEEAGLLITSLKKSSPTQQNSQDSESSNRGASSLVQIWEARLHRSDACLNRSRSLNNSRTSSASSQTETALFSAEERIRQSDIAHSTTKENNSRTSPASSHIENASSRAEERSRQSDIADSSTKEDTFVDCGTVTSAPSSIHFRDTDAGEPDKVKIVDIIRRLTSDGNDHDQNLNGAGDCLSGERRNSSGSDRTEQKVLPQVVNPPKIRGRQAFNDLLLQMEQERHRELGWLGERQAVSKFSQRGRIQSLLRLRFLHRSMAFEDQQRPRSPQSTTSCNGDRSQQGSTIMHLRERFSAGVEQATTLSGSTTPRSTTEMVNSIVQRYASVHNELTSDSCQQETSTSDEQESESQVENSASATCEVNEKVLEETCAVPGITWQGTSRLVQIFDPPETSETTPPLNDWDENEIGEEGEEYFEQINYDWFSDIARPRSYWEDQRKARYEEKLGSNSDNDEIRQLLERGTVSNFLASDLRDRIDQLMMSHAQRQASQEDEELEEDSQERMGQLMLSYFQRHLHPAGSQEEEQEHEQEQELDGRSEVEETVEEEFISEEGSPSSHQYMEATDYFDQSSPSQHSPYPFRSWNYSDDNEVADVCEQAQTTPLHLPLPPQASSQERRYSSSKSHSSLEMEFVYDLKGHMEQLQREMSELRKSIQSCMEMQMNLQNSLKAREVYPVQGNGENSPDRRPNKRSCCICYGKQVDSFLYRYLLVKPFVILNLHCYSLQYHDADMFQMWAYVHVSRMRPWAAAGQWKMSNLSSSNIGCRESIPGFIVNW
ncbi:ubiquitin-protein ligase [Populus alba x Populus x berolinensis]|uniref:Ubiquitin-protein ligase n=1 Tax=Populus alba x Populus x berolinensis TaxID=444605 RepID=A0AAD6RJM3_9ROSI|nr:ubiquitin-protein ligase [Populus alba x Populus x berolinensis]